MRFADALKKRRTALNLDVNVFLSLLSKGFSVLKTPISLIFITKYLDPVKQGYWFTILNLGALTVFAEMGFTTIVTQFVSHEYAHLQLDDRKRITGEEANVNRLLSLIWFSTKKYFLIIPIAIIIVLAAGFLFFRDSLYGPDVIWPWILYAMIGGGSLTVSFFSAVIQGVNDVKYALQVTLFANILNTIAMLLCLWLGLGLWSLFVSNALLVLFSCFFFAGRYRNLILQLYRYPVSTEYNWGTQVYPLQVKYSISWIAGYFIFYVIVPLTFLFEGPVAAGKVGITMQMSAAVLQMAHSWISTKMPDLNMLISRDSQSEARKLFRSLNKSSLLFSLFVSLIIVFFFYFDIFHSIHLNHMAVKFLPLWCIVLILTADFAKLLLGNWAVYLRAFKVEPYLHITLANATSTLIVFVIGLKVLHSITISLALYATIQLISLVYGFKILRKKG